MNCLLDRALTGAVEGHGVGFEIVSDPGDLEAGVDGFGGCGLGANGSLGEFGGGIEDGLGAPGEAIDPGEPIPCPDLAGVVAIEGGVDAAEDGGERDSGLAPCLDEGPVEGGE